MFSNLSQLDGCFGGGLFQLLDLLDQVGFLVVELLVLRPVRVELGQELDQLVLVPDQDVQDGFGLVGVGHKHFEHVKRLELDVSRFFLQHVHHKFEIVGVGNIFGHHRKVVSIKEEFAQQFERLPPSYIVITVKQLFVLLKNLKKI